MIAAHGRIKIRNKRLADAPNDYAWQSDPVLVQLDAAPLLTTTFTDYLSCYASELRNPPPDRRLFAIETTLDRKHIGNCVYYNINEDSQEAELGIMLGNRNYWDKGYGADAVKALVNHIFRETNLKRIHLKTLVTNERAKKCFQNCGFTPYNQVSRDGHNFVLMELHHDQWERRNQQKPDSGVSDNNEPR